MTWDQLNTRFKIGCTTRHFANLMKQKGIKNRIAKKRFFLSLININKRLKFAKKHLQKK